MEKKYIVRLTDEDHLELNKILSNGNASAKSHRIARVLLKADEPSMGKGVSDADIAKEIGISDRTVKRLREKYAAGGLEKVFEKKFTPRLSRRKFKGDEEAKLIALCCSEAPEGYARWSLRMLADKVVELNIFEEISYGTIYNTLKKMKLNHG